MSLTTLGTYSPKDLEAFYGVVPSVAWPRWLLEVSEAKPPDFEIGKIPVSVGSIARWLRGATKGRRARFLAYHWCDPRKTWSDDDLGTLAHRAGLSHLSPDELWHLLKRATDELIHAAPALRLWLLRRQSLLELLVKYRSGKRFGFERSFDRGSEVAHQNALHHAMTLAHADPNAALDHALRVATSSLELAAKEVCLTLGPRNHGEVTCNLMLPLRSADEAYSMCQLAEGGQSGFDDAGRLWAGVESDYDRVFAVALEARGTSHVGFWVPDVGLIAGAPEAARTQCGSVVHKRDKPKLTGLSEAMQRRWESYVESGLKEDLFVSVPLLVPSETGTAMLTAAVLNVNATCKRTDGIWPRAYHRMWLSLAAEHAAIHMHAALAAVRLAFGIRALALEAPVPQLVVGDATWDKPLPIHASARLLTAARPEQQK